MITFETALKTIDYRVTEGAEYCWNCYGKHARYLDSNGESNSSASIIFSTEDQTVFEISVDDFQNNRAYRWIHPDYVDAHRDESAARGVSAIQAWDEVNYVDLDVEEDILEKTSAILKGKDYDTRLMITLDLSDTEMLTLFKAAHEADVTFNEFVIDAIQNFINKEEETI